MDNRNLLSQLAEEPNTAVENIVNTDGLIKETANSSTFSTGKRLNVFYIVNEFTVALLGGDTTRGRMRLGDISFRLKNSHIVADSGA